MAKTPIQRIVRKARQGGMLPGAENDASGGDNLEPRQRSSVMGKFLALAYMILVSATMILWPSGWRSFHEMFDARQNRHSLWRYRLLGVAGVAFCLWMAFALYTHPEWQSAGAASAAQSDAGDNR